MCILFIAIEQHPDYPLIIAANRDEFYHRPTEPSAFWNNAPDILAGKDMEAGGSWMGINTSGHIAALTNYRDPAQLKQNVPSRGALVMDYLAEPSADYPNRLRVEAQQYNGFNLLFGHWQSLSVFSKKTMNNKKLTSGVYGLSNADLNTPWPKLMAGVQQLTEYCQSIAEIRTTALLKLLSNRATAPDEQLPETGIPFEWEKALSSIFIHLDGYGTRSSTVLLINRAQQVTWHEQTFNKNALLTSEHKYHFSLNN